MPSRAYVEWDGDKVIAIARRLAAEAVNETVDEAAAEAERSHPWVNRTLQLEEEIQTQHAHPGEPNPTGRFGTTKRRGFYGLFHELGTINEHRFPFLRPAADRVFPTLAEKIERKFRGR